MQSTKTRQRKVVNRSDPYGRTTWSGKTVDNRTSSALNWAQKKAGFGIVVVQGSYNIGVEASAGTHDKGGVVDIYTDNLTRRKRIRLIHALKKAGFAVWYRNWPGNRHIHAVLRGHRNLAWLAAQQVRDYDNGYNGLVSHLRDRTFRPLRKRRWSHRQNKPILGR